MFKVKVQNVGIGGCSGGHADQNKIDQTPLAAKVMKEFNPEACKRFL